MDRVWLVFSIEHRKAFGGLKGAFSSEKAAVAFVTGNPVFDEYSRRVDLPGGVVEFKSDRGDWLEIRPELVHSGPVEFTW